MSSSKPATMDRLRRGQRWWAAELALRAFGLALLGGCDAVAGIVHRIVVASPPAGPGLAAYALCAGAVVLFSAGLAFALFGPGLLRQVPLPVRHVWYLRER
jgi:hypothetical protein